MRSGSTTTITTVGYGEVFPVTGAGRLVGALTMVVGRKVITADLAGLDQLYDGNTAADEDHRDRLARGEDGGCERHGPLLRTGARVAAI